MYTHVEAKEILSQIIWNMVRTKRSISIVLRKPNTNNFQQNVSRLNNWEVHKHVSDLVNETEGYVRAVC